MEKSDITTQEPVEARHDGGHKGDAEDHVHADVDRLQVTTSRPYREVNFIFTYIAVCLGALASYGGFVMPATSLALINEDIGPSTHITWVALAWTLCLAVGYTLVGRLSDIFGRRWFFIGSSLLATIGCVVGGTATGVNQLIGANVLIGLAAAGQISFNYIVAELVPTKDRFYALALVFLIAIPFSAFGPVISRLLIVHTARGWRWDYYMTIIVNGISTLLYFFFYHPPNFDELHKSRSKWQEFKDIDFGGIVLFTAGLLLFLIGLESGGHAYPWGSARIVSMLVIGIVLSIAFVVYECFMPLRRPLVPMHLFRNRHYCVLTLISAVGGMLYYSMNVIYPTMIATLFTTDIVKGGLLSCAIGGGVGAGQFSSSLWATPGGNFRWKLFGSVVGCTAFTAALAGAKTQATASALAVLSAFFIGCLESLVGVGITLVLEDQTEIGVAVGVYGSIRSAFGVLATAIFSTILTGRVTQNTENNVVPALLGAGLPATSVEPLLTALAAGDTTAAAAIPGVSQQVLAVAAATIRAAYSNAFTLLFLVTLAFGGISCIAAYFSPAIEHLYTSEVMRRLHGGNAQEPAKTAEDYEKSSVEHKELA